tara:strand:- start:4933 stop:5280 length:348 start_codon:yes stop_codon:yes gene_type:complete
MATAMTFEYPQLDRVAKEGDNVDVVQTIHWRVNCVSDSDKDADGNYLTAGMYGTVSTPMEEGADFVAYDSITKDWCKAKVLADMGKTEEELKAALDADIAEQKTPSVLTGTPSSW